MENNNIEQDRNSIPGPEEVQDAPERNSIPGGDDVKDVPATEGPAPEGPAPEGPAPDVHSADGSSEVSAENGENSSGEVFDKNGEKSETGSFSENSDKPAPDTFPRDYVEKLRRESAGYRERAKRVDELERRLHAALVKADGRLADPEDLEFNVEHLDDPEALEAAITGLVERKPGLRARQYRGDVGAGKRGGSNVKPVDLIELMRGN